MAANDLARAVRAQLGLGRVLPLGGPADGAWISERAARTALLRSPGTPPDIRLGALRLTLDAPDDAPAPTVPPPPSALPPGPLRLTADVTAPPDRPLPPLAARLRTALLTAAEHDLGLRLTAVDLRITDLLDEPAADAPRDEASPGATEAAVPCAGAETGAPDRGTPPGPQAPTDPDDLAARILAVPGVARLAPALAGRSRPVARTDDGTHVLIQLATAAGHRPLDVARAVRRAVTGPPPAPETAAVLITAVRYR
ncbi:hypothetical protein [Streptomyces sp. WZ-12]|uniref:hypothetical protein n=1 Tax=Streptomyces sp. WZ-12 TaxID=3030210 RepID=UPI0023818FD5|nr:hypothetical protein [Streptomyces sp. WZ-12]